MEGPLALWKSAPKRAMLGLMDSSSATSSSTASITWVGALALALALLFLEWRQPFYFTQDDNFAQFLPNILAALDGAFAIQRFPVLNPFQFAGAPSAELGYYSLSYPPTWASYALARWLLGNKALTFEVFAWLHLFAGYAAFVWAARRLSASAWSPVLGALSWCLSGFILIAGRSWYYVLPWALYLPLFAGLLVLLKEKGGSWSWAGAWALGVGAAFHSGNVQLWSYAMLWLGAAALGLALLRQISWRSFAAYLLASLGGIGLALPLLLAQLGIVEGNLFITAPGELPTNLLALILPWLAPSAAQLLPALPIGPYHELIPQVLDCGGWAPLLALASLWPLLRGPRELRWLALWPGLLLLAWWAGLGPKAGLWPLIAKLPAFQGFQHPFKFALLVQFFACFAGALALDALLQQSWAPLRKTLLLGVLLLLTASQTWRAKAAFYTWAERPYPPLPVGMEKALAPLRSPQGLQVGRVLGVSPRWASRPGYSSWLVHALPSAYGIPSMQGYDPLIEASRWGAALTPSQWNDVEAGLRAWTVLWVLVSPAWNEAGRPNPWEGAVLNWAMQKNRKVSLVDGIYLIEVPKPDPLAFISGAPERPLAFHMNVAGAQVDLAPASAERQLTVGVLARPGWQAYANGTALNKGMDPWGRLLLSVPGPVTHIELRYEVPWGKGFLAGLMALALATLGLVWVLKGNREKQI